MVENPNTKQMSGAREDVQLVQRALSSSDEFGRIIEKYQEPLRRYVRRVARPSLDELDILLQDIFIKIYENLNDFDQELAFSSWIYRIAHNESIDYIRKKKRFGMSLDDPAYDDDTLSLVETLAAEEDISTDFDREQTKISIAKILEMLEPKYRAVLILKFLEEKDYKEISDILRKPPGTVATLIHRAKREFKRLAQEKSMNLEKFQ